MLNLAVLPEDNALAREAVAGGAPRLTYAEPDAAGQPVQATCCDGAFPEAATVPPAHQLRPIYPARTDAHPMRDDSWVTDLVTRARTGEKQAWDALVERYAPLLWSICRRYRLGRADADDAGHRLAAAAGAA